jgi:hypothetical protein
VGQLVEAEPDIYVVSEAYVMVMNKIDQPESSACEWFNE